MHRSSHLKIIASNGGQFQRSEGIQKVRSRESLHVGEWLLEREGDPATKRAVRLREVEGASICGEERPISLGEKIPDVDKSFYAIGKQVPAMQRLAQKDAQVGIGSDHVIRRDSRNGIRSLPAVRGTPMGTGLRNSTTEANEIHLRAARL